MLRIHKSVLVEGSPANGNALYYIEGACANADVSELPTGYAMGSKVWVVDKDAYTYYNEETESWTAIS